MIENRPTRDDSGTLEAGHEADTPVNATAKSIAELFDEFLDETWGTAGAGIGGIYWVRTTGELIKDEQ